MYINPFLAGVLATVITEITAVVVLAIIAACRRAKK